MKKIIDGLTHVNDGFTYVNERFPYCDEDVKLKIVEYLDRSNNISYNKESDIELQTILENKYSGKWVKCTSKVYGEVGEWYKISNVELFDGNIIAEVNGHIMGRDPYKLDGFGFDFNNLKETIDYKSNVEKAIDKFKKEYKDIKREERKKEKDILRLENYNSLLELKRPNKDLYNNMKESEEKKHKEVKQNILNTTNKVKTNLPIKNVLRNIKMTAAIESYNNKQVLSKEDNILVDKLVPKILEEMKKPNFDISEYGKNISTRPSAIADQLLKTTYVRQMEEFTNPIQELIDICKEANQNSLVEKIPAWANLPLIGKLYKSSIKIVDKAKSYMDTIDSQINTVVKTVESKIPIIKKRDKDLESLYLQNREDYYNFEAYIKAAEIFVKDKESELAIAIIEAKDDKMKQQDLLDKQDYIDSIYRRINNLKSLQIVSLGNAPSIRIQQNIGKNSLERFNDIKNIMISNWKTNCFRYITSLQQQKDLEIIEKSDEATNNLLLTTNSVINDNAVKSQKSLNKGAIKLETLEKLNNGLIETLQQIIDIKEEGRKELISNSERYKEMTIELVSKSSELISKSVEGIVKNTLEDKESENNFIEHTLSDIKKPEPQFM